MRTRASLYASPFDRLIKWHSISGVGVAHSAQELSYGLDDGGLIPGGDLFFATVARPAPRPTQSPIH
jgi:hypothetical protein